MRRFAVDGPRQLELQALTNRGYKVVTVPIWEWAVVFTSRAKKRAWKKQYLLQKLQS